MSEALVSLTIDGVEVTVPAGTLIVDAAKKIGIEIPVFCYHPKLKPVGMCRMCLVEIGRPKIDRATRAVVRDENGDAVIEFGPKLETACTTPVGEGWVVLVNSERAIKERQQVVEFLLTSHPLDCPVCDKGGECPLQNLTMKHGPGESRFLYEDKMRLDKHVPLGELIFLDRERCIQCSRCIRFQTEIVDDPVIAFSERGRKLEIVTYSEPGFNSYFSGNTTDICPVGALTTADFRFSARSWELSEAASICSHCAVGCNITLHSRREARSKGAEVIKRVIPRHNDTVNEIWICDKGRFAHHYASSEDRLSQPLIKRKGKLVKTSWEEALKRVVDGLKAADGSILGIAGGRTSNEDLFLMRHLMEGLGGQAVQHGDMAGGDLVQQVGVGAETNLARLGAGDCILVVASDLHEEAPIWWLRIKQAVERGAQLIVANARTTRLDAYASHTLRYTYGEAAHTMLGLLHAVNGDGALAKFASDETREASETFAKAPNALLFYGHEGMDYEGSHALAQACASLLSATGHVARPNNGLVAVWPRCNSQGAWDMGLAPHPQGLEEALKGTKAVYVMAADPAGDDPALASMLAEIEFLVVQELFLTETAKAADVVLPAQSFAEREGTYTNGMRRVQRFYPAIAPLGETRPDWQILAAIGEAMGLEPARPSAAAVLLEIASENGDYAGLDYAALAHAESQWPPVGGKDLYFGGTANPNQQGVGVQLPSGVERGEAFEIEWSTPARVSSKRGIMMIPITKLYDRGTTIEPSQVLSSRLVSLCLHINPEDAKRLKISDGGEVDVTWNGGEQRLRTVIEEEVPRGVVLVPRSLGVPLAAPVAVKIRSVGS
ncbi:MAG TPA: NADH-quinone oxidoreductase subunit NuoG [Anaerolineae bacterium]|nr:NADH-quinone oxidoreductase subunit NuoG [Anaerolineae bacterium]